MIFRRKLLYIFIRCRRITLELARFCRLFTPASIVRQRVSAEIVAVKDRGRLITKGMIERVVSSVFVYNHTITPPGIFNIYLSIFHLLSICLSIWRNFLYFSFLFHHIVPVFECVWRMKIEFKIFQLSFLLDENLFSL